jgi:hypothetical protein
MYMYLVPKGFRDRATSLYSSLDVRQDSIDEQHAMSSQELQCVLMFNGGIFENVLY